MKFRMVDRVLRWESGKRILGIKAVSFEEYSLKEPFGGGEHLPETLLLESLFQLGNWLIVLTSGFSRMGLVIRAERVLFEAPLLPGEKMVMEVAVRSYREDGVLFDGEARAGGRRIAAGQGVLAVQAPLSSFCDPGGLKILFDEIYRPEETEDKSVADLPSGTGTGSGTGIL